MCGEDVGWTTLPSATMAKARSLMDQIVVPAPLAPIATGNAKADAALAKLAAWEHSSAHPCPTPGGKDYDAAIKIARTAGAPALLELLDDATLTVGSTEWDDDAYGAMRPNDKKTF